jgi:toxin-antitoxin system PIN domain toxin
LIPLLDMNILIPAHRGEDPLHAPMLAYVKSLQAGEQAYALPELVLSAVVRIVTGKGFTPPSTAEAAFNFVAAITAPRHCVRVRPGESHWRVFESLARRVGAKGKLVTDAYLAALAIDQEFEFITLDKDYARFPGLTWRHPLASKSVKNPH